MTAPIQAFFGNLVQEPASRKVFPIALLNKQINLDQLLAIHKAMKLSNYEVAVNKLVR